MFGFHWPNPYVTTSIGNTIREDWDILDSDGNYLKTISQVTDLKTNKATFTLYERKGAEVGKKVAPIVKSMTDWFKENPNGNYTEYVNYVESTSAEHFKNNPTPKK